MTMRCACVIFFVACSVSQNTQSNFAVAMTSLPLLGYTGTSMTPSLTYKVYQLGAGLNLYKDFVDSIVVSAFTKSDCTGAAAGVLTGGSSIAFTNGVVSFSDLQYTPVRLEENVYLKGTLSKHVLSICSESVSVLQHFSHGVLTSGSLGANNLTNAAVVDTGSSVAVSSDGAFIVAGKSKKADGGYALAVWRILQNGSLDSNFGTSGVALVSTGAGAVPVVNTPQALAIGSDDSIVVVGASKNAAGGTQTGIWKLTSSGILDASFGVSGFLTVTVTASPPVNDNLTAVIFDASGNVLAGGTSRNTTGGIEAIALRLASGALDTSFAENGIFAYGGAGAAGALGASELDTVTALQLDSAGRILLAGSSKDISTHRQFALWRLQPSGNLDGTFATFGVLTGSTGTLDQVYGMAQSGTTVMLAGSSQSGASTLMSIWVVQGAVATQVTFAQSAAGAATTNDYASAIAYDTKLKQFVIAGTSQNSSAKTQLALWFVNATGNPVTSLVPSGFIVGSAYGAIGGMTEASVTDKAAGLVIDSMGTYIVTGSSLDSYGGQLMATWRYLPLGVLDY